MVDLPSPSPFRRLGPTPAALPVVLSVPHAGRAYSTALLRASRLPLVRLETLEDRLVDHQENAGFSSQMVYSLMFPSSRL